MNASQPTNSSIAARIFSGSVWVMGAHVAALGFVFFAQRIILTALSPEQNGTLFIERRLTELFVGLIADFGMNGVVLRRASQEPHRIVEIVSSALWFRLTLWTSALAVVVGYVYVTNGPVLDVVLWSMFMLIATRTTLIRYTLEIQHRATSRFIIPSVVAVLDAALFFAVIWFFRDSCTPTNVILMFLVSAIPGFAIVATIGRGKALLPSKASLQEMKTIAMQSLPLVAYVLLWGLQDKVDAAILEMFASRSDVGVLGAAYTSLGPLIAFLPQTLAIVMLPEIARLMAQEPSRAYTVTHALLRVMLVATTAIAATSIMLIPMYMEFVSGGQYRGYEHVFELFVWTTPSLGILAFAQEALVAMGRQRETVIIALVMVVFTFVGGLSLVPAFTTTGSVTSKVIASVAGAVTSLLILRRQMSSSLHAGFFLRAFAFLGATVALVHGTQWTVQHGPISPIIAAFVVCGTVLGLATLMRFIDRNEWTLLTRLILRKASA